MGQYHRIYNKTKKQYINAHTFNQGTKLLEQMGQPGSIADILFALICNSNGRGGGDINSSDPNVNNYIGAWAGDRIVVQGDYVASDDPAYISDSEIKKYTNISRVLLPLHQEIINKFS